MAIVQSNRLKTANTQIHDFKATTQWLKTELFDRHSKDELKQAVKVAEVVGGVIVGAMVAKKMLNALGNSFQE